MNHFELLYSICDQIVQHRILIYMMGDDHTRSSAGVSSNTFDEVFDDETTSANGTSSSRLPLTSRRRKQFKFSAAPYPFLLFSFPINP